MRAGDVYLAQNNEVYPANKKLSVCVCVSEEWFFLINSQDRKMYDCLPLSKKDHSFLKHDSYLSCSRVFTYEKSDIIKKLGRISAEDMRFILARVENSEVLEQKAIELICADISQEIN